MSRIKTRTSAGLLFDALAFAAHKHRARRRKDKEASPCINHPIALADKTRNLRGMATNPPAACSVSTSP